ncbi:glycosyltransferase family 2 protein [Candidatus Shapirobacteria bacterium CG_4_9_14_0_2_um_filter_39_11]|uniref:Glycosyltransferase family 2 protein n=1 Tax=Candidatus Shapirobacteria bacterium CG_4_9_14_0_2_um_filter_39_11 TaxID=1974478 RepID=A0A2M8ES31_9BACT|nr:MAG: glycosyltransferase family 2 protein [Candidatus Shapirobacteria bacterium CG_4_9_14_0_2_um_filter_39_11]
MKVTAVIPAKNEEEGIEKIIKNVSRFVDEVLVVDGHSKDKTRQIAKECGAKVVLDGGKGKGDGIRTGIRKAKGDIIVFIDADGSHNPKDIPKLIKPIKNGEADLVVASRAKGGSDEIRLDLDGLFRQIGSEIAAILVNFRWRANLTDIQNGFRAIRKKTALALKLESDGFEIEEEMIMKCLKRGVRIMEVAGHEYQRRWGVSKLPTTQAWRFLLRLFKELLTL